MNWLKRLSIIGSTTIASLAIAQSASARFIVFVSGNDPVTLQKVRTVSPAAFTTKVNSQPAVQAGTFNSETSADLLVSALNNSGIQAQKYFQASGGKETNVQVPFTDTPTTSVPVLPNPQQVVIQQNPNIQSIGLPTDNQQQFFNSVPQQTIAYTSPAQYQQVTTNTVVPQVQTQQVLVQRWQQVLVPETRQVVTQAVVPQTQLIQTASTQAYVQPTGYVQQTGYIQPATGYVQQTGYVQPATGYVQQTGYVQPQTSFISSSTANLTPTSSDNYVVPSGNFSSTQVQPVSNELSPEQQLPQQSVNPNFRYIAAVPAKLSNQYILAQVRQYVPNAFFTNSGRGTYIYAGAYQNRDLAESVSRYLRSQGIDSRVLYF